MSTAMAMSFEPRKGFDKWGNPVWFFFDKAIRVDESGDEPMFCLKDCFEANGLNHKGGLSTRPGGENKGHCIFMTPGGRQSFITITEHAFNVLTMRGHKPCSEEFRQWLANVAVQIRKKGEYKAVEQAKAQPVSMIQGLIQQSSLLTQALVAFSKVEELATEAHRLASDTTERIQQIEERKERAEERTRSLPSPSVVAVQKTDADLTEQWIRWHCKATGLDYQKAWGRFYEEIRRRLHIDVHARFRKSSWKYRQKLDVIRECGSEVMAQSYAIAQELFPNEPKLSE